MPGEWNLQASSLEPFQVALAATELTNQYGRLFRQRVCQSRQQREIKSGR
jgi:hypothetical protein